MFDHTVSRSTERYRKPLRRTLHARMEKGVSWQPGSATQAPYQQDGFCARSHAANVMDVCFAAFDLIRLTSVATSDRRMFCSFA